MLISKLYSYNSLHNPSQKLVRHIVCSYENTPDYKQDLGHAVG